MDRRDALRSLGASLALSLIPRDAVAAWERVAARAAVASPSRFSAAHQGLIDAVADTILPRTDTPGALDVDVAAFIDVIVHENYTDAERRTFLAGLDAMQAMAVARGAATFASLAPDARADLLGRIEALDDRDSQPQRTYWRLKGLVIHGYFTSERVMKEVLHHEVMPGRFDGNAPMAPRPIMAGQPRG